MSISRSVKRPGYNNLVGATNHKVTISSITPNKPKKNQIWIDTSVNIKKYWNGSAWVPIG